MTSKIQYIASFADICKYKTIAPGGYSFSCCDSSIHGSLFHVHQKTLHISSVNVVRCKNANVKIYEKYGTILLLFHNQQVVRCCH